jgi:glyoxylase I family protein
VKIEHAAYQVGDPVALARWYVDHLGMTVKRAQTASPFGHFLADDGDAVMLEFYANPRVQVPDYRAMDPLVLHIAFSAEDVAATRTRLIAAGATPEGDVQQNDAGDELAMLRDPWGLAVQLVSRRIPMIAPRRSRRGPRRGGGAPRPVSK